MSSTFLQLAVGSRDLSQAEKEIPVVTSLTYSQKSLKMVMGEQSCHFVSCSACTAVMN